MRAVLYTNDMIPITVMDVPVDYWEYLLRHGSIKLAVTPPMKLTPWDGENPKIELRTVDITVERFVRRGEVYLMLFTRDEESALLLKSTFLPGQQTNLRDIRDQEFARGFFKALSLR